MSWPGQRIVWREEWCTPPSVSGAWHDGRGGAREGVEKRRQH